MAVMKPCRLLLAQPSLPQQLLTLPARSLLWSRRKYAIGLCPFSPEAWGGPRCIIYPVNWMICRLDRKDVEDAMLEGSIHILTHPQAYYLEIGKVVHE